MNAATLVQIDKGTQANLSTLAPPSSLQQSLQPSYNQPVFQLHSLPSTSPRSASVFKLPLAA